MSCLLTEIDDELDDLETSNPLLPPDADSTSALEVVPVHDNVDSQVEGNGDPGHSCATDELSVAQQGSGAMVVAVQEGYTRLAVTVLFREWIIVLRGFFFKKRKTVSRSSRYLVR